VAHPLAEEVEEDSPRAEGESVASARDA